MNSNLTPLIQRLIQTDAVLAHLSADNLSQAALAYIRHCYVMDSKLTDDDQDLIEMIPAFADNLADSFRDSMRDDSSVYHLFDDGSLWVRTNAYEQVWADAADFASEILINKEKCSSIDIRLLRALGMEFLCDPNGDFSWQTTN
jgi:hypothetical protein